MHRTAQSIVATAIVVLGVLSLSYGAALATPAVYPRSRPSSLGRLAEAMLPGVVSIRTEEVPLEVGRASGTGGAEGSDYRDSDRTLLGSGFVIDRGGRVLTNAHVVSFAREVLATMADGRLCRAYVLGVDRVLDLALLQLDCMNHLHPLAMGDSDRVRTGDEVMTIGNPFGLEGSVSLLTVGAQQRYLPGKLANFIQTEGVINPGNSGGPLIDASGRVIGITTAVYRAEGSTTGIGFALPIRLVRADLARLQGHGPKTHAWIGAQLHPIAADLAYAMGLPIAAGALVTAVSEDSPAEAAGLRPGDVLTHVNGRRIRAAQSFVLRIHDLPSGSKLVLTINRHGRTHKLRLWLGSSPQDAQWLADTGDFAI
ncbi:MAG TPA: trypsin-like peptidase domain-containing protein [Candidatus Binataceae bacterium]|nr:trypsin-like peptidase domain-containing protein [Candidatus Binataceae bacterium]